MTVQLLYFFISGVVFVIFFVMFIPALYNHLIKGSLKYSGPGTWRKNWLDPQQIICVKKRLIPALLDGEFYTRKIVLYSHNNRITLWFWRKGNGSNLCSHFSCIWWIGIGKKMKCEICVFIQMEKNAGYGSCLCILWHVLFGLTFGLRKLFNCICRY